MSANAIANVEVLGTLAIVAIVAAAFAWPFVRWNRRLHRTGHQSPFVMIGLVCAYLATLAGGFFAGAVRSGICWNCTPAGNPEEYRQDLIGPHLSGFAISFIGVTLLGAAITGLIVRSIPGGRRRAGLRHTRFPWRGLARTALVCFVPLPVVYWRGWLTARDAFRVGQLLVIVWAACAGLARRSRSVPLEAVVAADQRPSVVYLRPFDREDATFASVKTEDCREWGIPVANPTVARQSATLEQFLSTAVSRHLGPFIALGDPSDYLPPEGAAARTYLADDHWKEAFEDLSRASACLLLAVGQSENLRWELVSIKERDLQRKLIVVTAPRGAWRWMTRFTRHKIEEQWTDFAADLAACGLNVGVYPGDGATITFDDRGSAVVGGTGAHTPEQYVMSIDWCLRAAQDSPGPKPPAPAPYTTATLTL